MKRYQMRMAMEGSKKYFYLWDDEALEIVPLPSKYLMHKTRSNRSPNTVRHIALSLSYYLNYAEGISFRQVCQMPFEEQTQHFAHFLTWLKGGGHLEGKQPHTTSNGTCNAYLKDVFGFFLYLADCGIAPPLRALSYHQITVANGVGVKRTLRSHAFMAYLKAEDRGVRAAEENEIITLLQACSNIRDQLLILMLAETGFRIGELLGVDYTRDIDYPNHAVRVCFRDDNENHARAKNAEYRRAKLSEDTFSFMMHYMSVYRKLLQRQNSLFINISGPTAGAPLKVESVYDMLNRLKVKTGIKVTPHMLRRYYARTRRAEGWKLELISLALGHKHLDTTIRYLGILDDQLMEASRAFYTRHSSQYGIDKLL